MPVLCRTLTEYLGVASGHIDRCRVEEQRGNREKIKNSFAPSGKPLVQTETTDIHDLRRTTLTVTSTSSKIRP